MKEIIIAILLIFAIYIGMQKLIKIDEKSLDKRLEYDIKKIKIIIEELKKND